TKRRARSIRSANARCRTHCGCALADVRRSSSPTGYPRFATPTGSSSSTRGALSRMAVTTSSFAVVPSTAVCTTRPLPRSSAQRREVRSDLGTQRVGDLLEDAQRAGQLLTRPLPLTGSPVRQTEAAQGDRFAAAVADLGT